MKKLCLTLLGILLLSSVIALSSNQTAEVYVVNATEIKNEAYSPACVYENTNLTLNTDIIWGECEGGEAWVKVKIGSQNWQNFTCLLYTSPSPRDLSTSRMPSSA